MLNQQGRGGSIVFVASKNALVAGKNASAYSSAKAAELHLARCLAEEGGATRHPRQHRQPRRRAPGLAHLGLVTGARSAPPPTASSPTSSRSTTASARRCGVNIFPEDIAQAVLHFASPARSGKSTGNMLNVDGGVPAAYARVGVAGVPANVNGGWVGEWVRVPWGRIS